MMSSFTTIYDTLLKWTLAKRKMIVQRYGTPSGHASYNALLYADMHQSDTDGDAPGAGPSKMECTGGNDDTEAVARHGFV
jgi:hypothetical protein